MEEDPILHTITRNLEFQRENRSNLVSKYLNKYNQYNPGTRYETFDNRIKEANPGVVWSKLELGQVVNIPMDIPKEEQEEETTEETTTQETNNEPTSESTNSTETEEETTQESSGKPSKAGIYPVCNGAECMCDQSKEKLPALLKVISHTHVYINDKNSAKKLIATTNDLPLPFEKQANTFGTCLKQPLGFGQYKACIPNITKWDKSYQAIKLAQAGNGEALLEESEGECSFKGKITFTTHGQTQVVTIADAAETPPEIAAMLTDGILTEEEAEKLANGTFKDNKSVEIIDINVKGSLKPDETGTYKINHEHKTLTFKVNEPKQLTAKEKAAINWAVYIKNKNGTYKHHHTFIDQGATFTFPYRTADTYAIEAYGDTKKLNTATGKGGASNLLEIAYQQIKGITLYGNNDNRTQIKQIRPTETTTINIDSLFPNATAINPKNILWQATCGTEKINFEKISGATQITIPPLLNTEPKEVTVSATLDGKTKSITFKIKKNTVASVSANKNTICVISQGEQEKERHKVTFTAKYLLPYNSALGDPIPKWCVYNTNEDPHAKNIIAGENKLTYTGTSNKIGEWYVEAFAKKPDGKGTKAILKAIQPKITKAYWADKNGNSISKSGFKHTVYIHLETQALQGEQLQLNVWFGKQGSGKYQKQPVPCIEITQANGIVNQGYTLPEFNGTDNLDYFFTIENLPFTIQGTDQYPQAQNQLIVSNNCTPKFLNLRRKQQITSLKIYETDNKLHTGIIKYGDAVTVKISTRNLIEQELEFEIWKDVKTDNHTDNYSTYDTWDDEDMKANFKIKIDNEGNGEHTFIIPKTWEDKHEALPQQPYYFYLKEKESGAEFPRAYYVANPNKTEEENKSNSKRIRALMLKVAKDDVRDGLEESVNAVILGEELKLEENFKNKKKQIIFPLLTKPLNDPNKKWGKNFYWRAKQGDNMTTFNTGRKTNKCGSWERMHAARDLYTNSFTPVVAICDGEVLRVDTFYMKTDQITILHKTDDDREFIIRYGELAPNRIKLKKGDKVKQRQILGVTGKLLKKNDVPLLKLGGTIVFMLHFEYYTGALGYNLNKSLSNCEKPFTRRSDLADPIDILIEGYNNTFKEEKTTNDKRVNPKTLKTSEKGIQFIKDWEKFEPNVYDDSEGYCTIGYGHLIERKKCENIKIPTEFANGITEAKATELFKSRLVDFEKTIHNQVKVNLYQYEFDALVSLIFNIGSFSPCPKLKSNLDSANYEGTANEFSDITNNGTSGLVKRRNAEINIFKNNIYDSTH